LWKCADQASILTAIGVPPQYRAPPCPSFFLCDAPLDSREGEAATRFNPAEARAMLAATAYRGQPIAFLTTAGGISQTAQQVMTQAMQQAGFVVQEQVMDWGTLLARRARREGWHMFSVYANGTDMISPLTHFYVSNTCSDYPGWDCDPGLRGLIDDFAVARDGTARRALAARIQAAAVAHVPAVMWGQFTIPAGYRDRLRNLPRAAYPMFWEVEV
jgi:peptide/nickel transport system substrate-binding protein